MPKKVWQENIDKSFEFVLTEVLEQFEKAGFHVNYWEPVINGIPCYVCKKIHKTINYNGQVLKCTANDDFYVDSPKGVINQDGSISWENDYFTKYTTPTYHTKRCEKCKILPVCYGQCPRNWIQAPEACKQDATDLSFQNQIITFINHHYSKLQNSPKI